ncbi:hypothetical protein [Chryseobacterium hispalense]
MWDYWFSKPLGYEIKQYKDPKIDAAQRILTYLSAQNNPDSKMQNFLYEILGFINLVQGNNNLARDLYEKAIHNPEQTYNVTLVRGKEILKRMNDLKQ